MTEKPALNKNGTINNKAQNAEIFPKFRCQKWGATSGNPAMDKRIPANGITHNMDKFAPSKWGVPLLPLANAMTGNNNMEISIFIRSVYLGVMC